MLKLGGGGGGTWTWRKGGTLGGEGRNLDWEGGGKVGFGREGGKLGLGGRGKLGLGGRGEVGLGGEGNWATGNPFLSLCMNDFKLRQLLYIFSTNIFVATQYLLHFYSFL